MKQNSKNSFIKLLQSNRGWICPCVVFIVALLTVQQAASAQDWPPLEQTETSLPNDPTLNSSSVKARFVTDGLDLSEFFMTEQVAIQLGQSKRAAIAARNRDIARVMRPRKRERDQAVIRHRERSAGVRPTDCRAS